MSLVIVVIMNICIYLFILGITVKGCFLLALLLYEVSFPILICEPCRDPVVFSLTEYTLNILKKYNGLISNTM